MTLLQLPSIGPVSHQKVIAEVSICDIFAYINKYT